MNHTPKIQPPEPWPRGESLEENPEPPPVKNCMSCAHMYHHPGGESYGLKYAKCAVTGFYVELTRQSLRDICNEQFSRWEPKDGVATKPQVDQEKKLRGIPQWMRKLLQ